MSSTTVRGFVFASLSAACALANVAVAVPAHAATIDQPTAIVRYGDLDLTTERGVARLNRRILAAAAEVCARPDVRDLRRAQAYNDCRTAATSAAAPRVATLIEQARNGTRLANAASVRVAAN